MFSALLFALIFEVITTTPSYIGFLKADKYKNRILELRDMRSALNIFKNKIIFTYEPIGEIFKQIYSDTNNNIANMFEEFLKKQIEKAEDERKQNEKLYRSLGVICGIGISIILF